jgi:hypothetical protein
MVASISSAFAASIDRSIFGPPFGDSIERISFSERPAACPRAMSAN